MKSKSPSKPNTPVLTNPLLDRLDPTQRKVLLVGLIAFFVLAGLTTLLLAYYVFEPDISSFFATPTPTMTPTPTPLCDRSTLQMGTTTIHFESITRAVDGSINLPIGTSGVAYWIEDLENNYIFVLSPTPDNLKLVGALQAGNQANITWENCNSAKYTLAAPETGTPGTDILTDQAKIGLIIYVPASTLSSGVWVQGQQVEEIFKPFETPKPGENVINAEVSLLETTTSPDKKTIQVTISIINYGTAPLTISNSNILITPENGAAMSLISSEPALPLDIKYNESKTIILSFPRPTSIAAVLKILNIEFDLEGY